MSVSITNSRVNHLRIAMCSNDVEAAKALATKEGFLKALMYRLSSYFLGHPGEKHTRISGLVDLLYDLRASFGDRGLDTERLANLVAKYKQKLSSLSADFSGVSMFFCYDRGTQKVSMCVQTPGYEDAMIPLADLSGLSPAMVCTIPLIWIDSVTGTEGNNGTPAIPGMHGQVMHTVEQLELKGSFDDSYEAFQKDASRMRLDGEAVGTTNIMLDDDDRVVLARIPKKYEENHALFSNFLSYLAKVGKFSEEQKLAFFKVYNQNMFVAGKLITGMDPIVFSGKSGRLRTKIAEENGKLVIEAMSTLDLVKTGFDTQDVLGECHSLTRFSIDRSGSVACITATAKITRRESLELDVGQAMSAIEAYNNLINDRFMQFSCKQIVGPEQSCEAYAVRLRSRNGVV
ncbi:hypothetical protein [Burkholderia sp. Bp8986]|uniref:hypothetical protein n=1 Tax=Burkholderia sp. Bp8986 TaxID=2184550 RepID=UPI000F595899|nr:hypothetical protein [Burkholderia sp. Bp8986]